MTPSRRSRSNASPSGVRRCAHFGFGVRLHSDHDDERTFFGSDEGSRTYTGGAKRVFALFDGLPVFSGTAERFLHGFGKRAFAGSVGRSYSAPGHTDLDDELPYSGSGAGTRSYSGGGRRAFALFDGLPVFSGTVERLLSGFGMRCHAGSVGRYYTAPDSSAAPEASGAAWRARAERQRLHVHPDGKARAPTLRGQVRLPSRATGGRKNTGRPNSIPNGDLCQQRPQAASCDAPLL